MKVLIEDYKRRLATAEKIIDGFPANGLSRAQIETQTRIKTKASEYRTMIAEMEKESNKEIRVGDVWVIQLWDGDMPEYFYLSKEEAEGFYAVHKDRPFFNDLITFMTSGPVMIQALEGDNAVLKNRELMGATNPKEANAGTIRADFADSIDANAVHGSDSLENAKIEIEYFFG